MKAAINRRAAQLSKLAIKLNSEDFTVFCDFQGHVQQISIQVHLKGWDHCSQYDWKRDIYLDNAKAMECLEDTIADLQELKKTCKVPVPPNASDQGTLSDGR